MSTSSIVIAFTGHSSIQIPHPLQYSKSILGGIVRVITASGQNNQQLKHDNLPDFTGMHLSKLMTGFFELQVPVRPASPFTDFCTDPRIF